MLESVTLAPSPVSPFFLFFFPPAPFTTEVVATLSSEGDRENRGEPTLSASGLKAFRRLEGLRFLLGAPESEEMLFRLRGTLSCGMCGGGDAMARFQIGRLGWRNRVVYRRVHCFVVVDSGATF